MITIRFMEKINRLAKEQVFLQLSFLIAKCALKEERSSSNNPPGKHHDRVRVFQVHEEPDHQSFQVSIRESFSRTTDVFRRLPRARSSNQFRLLPSLLR